MEARSRGKPYLIPTLRNGGMEKPGPYPSLLRENWAPKIGKPGKPSIPNKGFGQFRPSLNSPTFPLGGPNPWFNNGNNNLSGT